MSKQWSQMDAEEKLEYLRESLIRANQSEVHLQAEIRALKLRVKALEDTQGSKLA